WSAMSPFLPESLAPGATRRPSSTASNPTMACQPSPGNPNRWKPIAPETITRQSASPTHRPACTDPDLARNDLSPGCSFRLARGGIDGGGAVIRESGCKHIPDQQCVRIDAMVEHGVALDFLAQL